MLHRRISLAGITLILLGGAYVAWTGQVGYRPPAPLPGPSAPDEHRGEHLPEARADRPSEARVDRPRADRPPAPAGGSRQREATAAPATPVPEPERDLGRPVHLTITAIGVDDPVVPIGLDGDQQLDPPPFEVGWYEGSWHPGEPGPAIIGAHVAWREHGPDRFARLGELAVGQSLTLTSRSGVEVAYEVEELVQLRKGTRVEEYFAAMYEWGEHKLVLVTCGGDLRGGSFQDNVFVVADPVSATQQGGA